jgi:hypothetical protein
MKIYRHYWFKNETGRVGVVLVPDQYTGSAYYIGVATGDDEQKNLEHIALHGSKLPQYVGDAILSSVSDVEFEPFPDDDV